MKNLTFKLDGFTLQCSYQIIESSWSAGNVACSIRPPPQGHCGSDLVFSPDDFLGIANGLDSFNE